MKKYLLSAVLLVAPLTLIADPEIRITEDSSRNYSVEQHATDWRDPFPHATSCSCNLTDSCSVSCYGHASCNPYWWDGGYYCSCYCD